MNQLHISVKTFFIENIIQNDLYLLHNHISNSHLQGISEIMWLFGIFSVLKCLLEFPSQKMQQISFILRLKRSGVLLISLNVDDVILELNFLFEFPNQSFDSMIYSFSIEYYQCIINRVNIFFIPNISKIPQSMNWRNYIIKFIKNYKRNYYIPKIMINGLSN